MAIRHYWPMAAAAVGFRLVLVLFGGDLHLASRPEVSTPLTSIRRLAEGYWLKQASMSPYSDFIAAMLIRATGHRLNITRNRSLNSLELTEAVSNSVNISAGDIASLIYLWNPWAIVTCVGSCTSPIENLMVVIMIYGACSRLAPLAAFGYVMSTHLTLYPAILIVPFCATTFVCSLVFIYLIISATYPYSRLLKTRFLFQIILLLGYGPDTPPAKVFRLKISSASKTEVPDNDRFSTSRDVQQFMWKPVFYFVLWMFFWSCYVLLLSSMILNKVDGLQEMFEKTYGFILTVKDLSPNIGVLWSFFLIVINMNIVFMVLPLAIRLKHRPCFLAFVYTAIVAMLKSYPSGTGNANFYFATGLAYTCIQTVLVVESSLE
uniref:GPI transamidase subunit PIG-U n=1 Tax=Oryza barthii TaxID=65489 RepID=A0A0D3EWS9_9ORYZ